MRISLFKQLKVGLLLLAICFSSNVAFASDSSKNAYDDRLIDQYLNDKYPWSVMYYYGITGTDALVQIFHGDFHRWPEHVQSVELAKTLEIDNPVRSFFSPIVGVVQLAGNVAVRKGADQATIYEFEPYLFFRWTELPWNNYVNTSLGLGEGVSYVTAVPEIEKRDNQNTKRFLNYLAFEATFAAPSYPQLQFVARIHHRSGAYGLYHAGNSGSNDIGVGIRYLFD